MGEYCVRDVRDVMCVRDVAWVCRDVAWVSIVCERCGMGEYCVSEMSGMGWREEEREEEEREEEEEEEEEEEREERDAAPKSKNPTQKCGEKTGECGDGHVSRL